MKKVILAVLCAASTQAFAADNYASVSLGQSEQTMKAGGYAVAEKATGFKLAFGGKFGQYLGGEMGVAVLGDMTMGDATMSFKSEPSSVYGALTAAFPVAEKFALTGKVGVARNTTKITIEDMGYSESGNDSATSMIFGFGASYALNEKMSLIAEYENFGDLAKDGDATIEADMVSVGLRFSF